jgi:hypothetical protein
MPGKKFPEIPGNSQKSPEISHRGVLDGMANKRFFLIM